MEDAVFGALPAFGSLVSCIVAIGDVTHPFKVRKRIRS
jgi:hypothetical protein